MYATSTQSNEDAQVLQHDHRLLLLAQHDRSVYDIFLRIFSCLTPVVACRNSAFWRWVNYALTEVEITARHGWTTARPVKCRPVKWYPVICRSGLSLRLIVAR